MTVVGIACIVGTLQCEGARVAKRRAQNNVSIEEDYSTSFEEMPIDPNKIIPSVEEVNKQLNAKLDPFQLWADGSHWADFCEGQQGREDYVY